MLTIQEMNFEHYMVAHKESFISKLVAVNLIWVVLDYWTVL